MNNYINPYSLIKEFYSEATTFSQKSLVLLVGAWTAILAILAVTGIGKIAFELVTNPTQFNNITWGIFDTLG